MRLLFLPATLGLLALAGCPTDPPARAAQEPTTPVSKPEPTDPPQKAQPVALGAPPEPAAADVTRRVVEGLNAFGVEFYKRAANGSDNSVLSPMSVALALGMVHAGAKGETATEIGKALNFEGKSEDIYRALSGLLVAWNEGERDYELAVVDRLFGEKTVEFERSYLDLSGRYFRAPLEPTDFKGAPEPSRKRVNEWVEAQTKDRIQDLLPPGAVTPETRLVLVNAIYFKAAWVEEFSEHATQDAPFFAASGEKNVPMMRKVHGYQWSAHKADKLQVLQLPYRGGPFAMSIVLPDEKAGLAAVERAMTADKLNGWLTAGRFERVDLRLPKFKIEMPDPLLLSRILQDMGIRRVFNFTQADLTGIAPKSEQLEISEGYHKAFIAVDEKGTEAAAATALGMERGAARPPDAPKPFIADHPFLYVIRDKDSGAVLFMGRVADPS